jgi:hypothetical protein
VSTGAGRVERAIRALLAESQTGGCATSIDARDVASRLGWGEQIPGGFVELTRSQQSSILRALRRVLADQPGWERRFYGHRVRFIYWHPDWVGPSKGRKLAAAATMQRPISQRQQVKDRAAHRRRPKSP